MAVAVISVCCPSRGRPDSMRRLAESIAQTATGPVEIVFYTDDDDSVLNQQAAAVGATVPRRPDQVGFLTEKLSVRHIVGPRITLSDMWNAAATVATGEVLMQCGDDIVFRTCGWDRQVLAAFERFPDRIALVHGDDGMHAGALGTHPFLHRRWVDTVGYLVPPGFACDWSDTWVNEVADALGRRVYLPQVLTEHLHPLAGKARLDDTHRQRLAAGRRDRVAELYAHRAGERAADVAKLRAVMEEKSHG